ncbi:hypothetical protein MASR2M78_14420 [Treponema sp.]
MGEAVKGMLSPGAAQTAASNWAVCASLAVYKPSYKKREHSPRVDRGWAYALYT